MDWPASFFALKRGEGCPMCEQGRPEETEHGARFFAGEVADAYMQRANVQRGYSVVSGGDGMSPSRPSSRRRRRRSTGSRCSRRAGGSSAASSR